MDRRHFLRKGLIAAGSAAILVPATAFGRTSKGRTDLGRMGDQRLFGTDSSISFSLNVLTDDANKSIRLVDSFLKRRNIGTDAITFEALPLPGRHAGDIAYLQNGRLFNFYEETDVVARELRSIALEHGFPRTVDNPILLRYRVGSTSGKATTAEIFRNGVPILSLPLGSDLRSHRIEGANGHVTVSIQNGGIQVVDASCRHKTCMELGHAHRAGDSLACIPARVSIRLDGQSNLDGISL